MKEQKSLLKANKQGFLLSKAPHRAFRQIPFDFNEIKKDIPRLTIEEAARMRGPIYEALCNEMYSAGCHMLPKFLRCLGETEELLYSSRNIRERITEPEYRKLFYGVLEKLKEAELSVVRHQCAGNKHCLITMFETIDMIEPYKMKFEYVLTALYEKLISFCHHLAGHEGDCGEVIARIFYKYSQNKKAEGDRANGISYLEKALNLARGHTYPADPKNKLGPLLHELIAQTLARDRLEYGHQIVRNHPQEAVDLAYKAALVTAEIGREQNMELFCTTFLDQVYFLTEKGDFEKAKHVLHQIKPEILKRTDYSFVQMNIKFYLSQGNIQNFFEQYDDAIISYQKALKLCCTYQQRMLEPHVLLCLGKIFAKNTLTTANAKDCYEKAKIIYIENGHQQNKKKTVYLLAKLKADEISPLFMDMIKASGQQYCAFYNLQQWKNRCRPFWTNLGEELKTQREDILHCLLNEEGNYKDRLIISSQSETDGKY